jgi:hypothetical protein
MNPVPGAHCTLVSTSMQSWRQLCLSSMNKAFSKDDRDASFVGYVKVHALIDGGSDSLIAFSSIVGSIFSNRSWRKITRKHSIPLRPCTAKNSGAANRRVIVAV